jgi:hypothetical protein
MNALIKYATVLIVLCCHATTVSGKELVREFRGSESAVEVTLLRAGTGVFVGSALRTKQTGNGVRLFQEDGRFQFRVNSTLANWTLRVEQLTKAEARLYTPFGEEPGKEVEQ